MLNLLRLTDGSNYYWWTRAGFSDDYVVWFFVFSSFLFGSCLGSFLNVCIWRMPLGESIVTAPSHCPKCGTPIRWFDNIPVVSYLALRGRCRSCKAPISPRYVIVEALTGILFALLLFKVGATQQPPFTLLLYFTMTLLCITTIWIDFEHRLIPDATTYPAILFGLAASAAFPSVWGVSNHLLSGAYALISGAAAGGALALFAIVGRAVSGREVSRCWPGRCSDRSTAYSARSAAGGNSPASRFRSDRSSPSAASHGCSRAKSSCAGISVSFRILNRNCGAEGLHSSARVLYYPEQRPAMLRNRTKENEYGFHV